MPTISVFDIFKIGVGPSSSHTVGPMKAARQFGLQLAKNAQPVDRIRVTLHGSLAYTGKGHGTDSAVILGLLGCEPETIDPDEVEGMLRQVHAECSLTIPQVGVVAFDPETDLLFDLEEELPRHTNGMRFSDSGKPSNTAVVGQVITHWPTRLGTDFANASFEKPKIKTAAPLRPSGV